MIKINKFKGKIISLAGCPASGKTFLGEILKKELNAQMLYEHPEEGFPLEIQTNLKNQTNLLETILFFRNIQIKNHLEAIELKKNNITSIIETPFYHNQLFVDLYIKDSFTKNILYEMGKHDLEVCDPADLTIYISTTTQLVKTYLEKRYGEREWEKDTWFNFISQLPPQVESYMNKIKPLLGEVIEIKRHQFDFLLNEDKEKLFTLMNKTNIN